MLIRTLLLAIFLISSALSVCAAEPVLTPDVAESVTMSASSSALAEPATSSDVVESITMPASSSKVTSARAMTMDEALKHVTISTEDWLDGNTYYIRYTFTNPTDVAIDKKVDLTTVEYSPYKSDCFLSSYNSHCCDEITRLTILPHNSYEATVSFVPAEDAGFYRLRNTSFYLEDGSSLHYNSNIRQKEKALYTITTGISRNNELRIAIRNRSFFNTITSIDNLSIQLNTLRGYFIIFASDYTLPPVNIKPRETAYFSLFPIDSRCFDDNDKFSESSALYKRVHKPVTMPIELTLDINHIPHFYAGYLPPHPPTTPLEESTVIHPFAARYDPNIPVSASDSIYILDESYLYAYIQVPQSKILSTDNTDYHLYLDYFTQDRTQSTKTFYATLPIDTNAESSEIKYYCVKFPLPDDFYTITPATPLYFSHYHPLIDSNKINLLPTKTLLLPVPADKYISLDATLVDSSDDRP